MDEDFEKVLEQVPELLIHGRVPRSNAGAKMAQLLHRIKIEENSEESTKFEEEDDEDDRFYQNLYGGFQELSDDSDFDIDKCSTDSEDQFDSDYSEMENEDGRSVNCHKAKKHRPRKLWTKVSRETRGSINSMIAECLEDCSRSKEIETKPAEFEPYSNRYRESTLEKRKQSEYWQNLFEQFENFEIDLEVSGQEEVEEIEEEEEDEEGETISDISRDMSQEEMLEEAKITEIENQKSLDELRKLWQNSDDTTLTKRIISMKRNFHRMKEDDNCSMVNNHSFEEPIQDGGHDNGKSPSPSEPRIDYCPITRQVARFRDPLTGVGYYDSRAFCRMRSLMADFLISLGQIENAKQERLRDNLDYNSRKL